MPENDDPGDGEINDVEEFLREFDRVEYDDTLLDLVGEGYDVNAPGDQDVADLLGAWRDDVGRVPVDESRFPSAHTASGKMPPTTGGTPRMINEGAQILANAATNADTVRGMVNSAEESVRSAAAALQEAIGVMGQISGEVQTAAGGTEGENLGGMGQQATSELDQLLSGVAMFDPNEAMGYIGQFFDAVSQAAQKHSS